MNGHPLQVLGANEVVMRNVVMPLFVIIAQFYIESIDLV
ncbi:hypothetical protein VCSRO90_2808 [Vibrio cholerae]|nr:hypothetical protein VCSRO136_2261 [Vibrio cholerae]GIB16762.1 hypothetical protein VCSRO90_2808 [Vibrio cholerae]